jgi:glycosyltransferase involved in cell wall biosynthesis
MNELRITHVSALPGAGGRGPVGGVGTYMASLLHLFGRTPFAHTVIANRDASLDEIAGLPANVSAVPTWRFGDWRAIWQVLRGVRASHPQIVHVQHELFLFGQGAKALLFPLLLARLTGAYRVVVTVHGVTTAREIDESLLAGRRSPVPLALVRRVIVGIFTAIARSRAHLVVHSSTLRERLLALGASPDRVSVIAHPLFSTQSDARPDKAEARAALGIDATSTVVLTWGYWNGYKGLDELVAGFAAFRRSHPNAQLIMGTGPHPQLHGDAAYMASYQTAMEALGSGEGVRIAGFIDAAQLPVYVAAADVCIFAYTKHLAASGPASYAVTLGTPVLVSSVFPDVPEQIVFEPNPNAIAAALERFVADPESHARAGEALRERSGDDTIVAAYEALYRKLADRLS